MNIFPTRDHDLIAKLNEEVQNIHAELMPELFKSYAFEEANRFIARLIDNPEYIFLVGVREGEYVGYAWVELKEYAENAIRRRTAPCIFTTSQYWSGTVNKAADAC